MKIDPNRISINSINLYKAKLEAEDSSVLFDKVEFSFDPNSAFSLENKAVRLRLNIKIDAQNDKDMPVGLTAEYGIEFLFIIDNFDDFMKKEKDDTVFDGLLGSTLMGIAFSTARGIILEQTKNTPFKGIILPVIDPKTLLT